MGRIIWENFTSVVYPEPVEGLLLFLPQFFQSQKMSSVQELC